MPDTKLRPTNKNLARFAVRGLPTDRSKSSR